MCPARKESTVRFRLAAALAAILCAAPAAAFAQSGPSPHSVAAFDVALYTAGANVQEASDTARAELATAVLRRSLDSLLGPAVVDSAAVHARVAQPEAHRLAGDHTCNVIVACTQAVAQGLGARWVVMAKVSKTSNLIWLLTGQLIDAQTGEIVLDDSIELKGDPEPMIRAGVRNFAVRAAREVKKAEGPKVGRAEGNGTPGSAPDNVATFSPSDLQPFTKAHRSTRWPM